MPATTSAERSGSQKFSGVASSSERLRGKAKRQASLDAYPMSRAVFLAISLNTRWAVPENVYTLGLIVGRYGLMMNKNFKNIPVGTPAFLYQWDANNYLMEQIWFEEANRTDQGPITTSPTSGTKSRISPSGEIRSVCELRSS